MSGQDGAMVCLGFLHVVLHSCRLFIAGLTCKSVLQSMYFKSTKQSSIRNADVLFSDGYTVAGGE